VKFPNKEIAPKVLAQHQEKNGAFNYDPAVPIIISAPQPIIPKRINPGPKFLFQEPKYNGYVLPEHPNVGASVPRARNRSKSTYKTLPFVYEAPIATDANVRLKGTGSATAQQQFLFLSPNNFVQIQKFSAPCKQPARITHSFHNHCHQGNSKDSDFCNSLICKALILRLSTPASDLLAAPATSVEFSSHPSHQNDSSSFLSSSATASNISDNPSQRNSLESICGFHETADGTCDSIYSAKNPAEAIIPAALNACTVKSNFCTDRGKNNVPSDHRDSAHIVKFFIDKGKTALHIAHWE
jgi:hypothetical protein